MSKLPFIISLLLIAASCERHSNTRNENAIVKADSSNAFDSGDTIANVKELIVYNRTDDTLLKNLPAYLAKFIPGGYAPLDTVSADLNADGTKDFLLASYKIGEDSIRPSPKRNLKILLGQPGNSYKLECESWNALAPLDMGGFTDPYPGIIAGKGKFVIQFSGGSNWKQTFSTTFEYSPAEKDWIQTLEIQESYFMDKHHYKSETLTEKQFGYLTFKKNYCKSQR